MKRPGSMGLVAGAVVATLLIQPTADGRAGKAGKPLPGIILVTNGPSILLSWDPKSPLGSQLYPRTKVEVVAAYESPAGLVSGEPIASAIVEPGNTALQFDLGTHLRNPPNGPVCLRLRYGRNNSIPLRLPKAGESSDGFRHPRWEASVAKATLVAQIERDRARATEAIATLEGMQHSFERWRTGQGFADAAACESIRPKSAARPPPTAITGSAQEPAAQYQCVGQYSSFVNYSIARPGIDARAFAGEMSAALRREKAAASANSVNSKTLNERIAQVDRLVQAIASHPEATGRGFNPLLQHNGLSMTSEAIRLISRNGGKPDAVAAAAVLDAFGSCLSEARSQFELAHQNWRASMNPALLEKRAELDRKDCRARFASEADRLRELSSMQTRLADLEDKARQAGDAPDVARQAQASLIPNGCSGR